MMKEDIYNDILMEQRIIEKIKKILELRDRGLEGEAKAAEELLKKICLKHGISLDEVIHDDKKVRIGFHKVSDPNIRSLLLACYYMVTNETRVRYYYRGRGYICFEVSPSQAIDLQEIFPVMKKAFQRQMKRTMSDYLYAFIIKNGLFSRGNDDPVDISLSQEEKEKALRIAGIMSGMERTPIPRKMIDIITK